MSYSFVDSFRAGPGWNWRFLELGYNVTNGNEHFVSV